MQNVSFTTYKQRMSSTEILIPSQEEARTLNPMGVVMVVGECRKQFLLSDVALCLPETPLPSDLS